MVVSPTAFRRRVEILVTDDDVRWRQGLREAFEPRGYETIEADSGEVAVEMVRSRRPHLMILDNQLPQMSGMDTLRVIREEIRDELPAIVVSSEVSDRIMAEALALHAFTVLSKMVGMHRILHAVAQVLARYYSI